MKTAKKIMAAVLCGSMLLAAGCSVDGENTSQPEPQYITLRIGSYNIAHGKLIDFDVKQIAQDILDQKLDIVGFQEVDRLANRSRFIDTMKLLSEHTGYAYYYFVKAKNIGGDEATYGQKGEYGTGILSKYPITLSESYPLESGDYEQRMLGYVNVLVDDTVIHFFNTHLSYEEYMLRYDQFHTIAEKTAGREPCIVTGDFNISIFSEYDVLKELKTTCNKDNKLITFPSTRKSIDNILYSQAFELVSSGVVENGHSDHNLLYAELRLQKTAK